VSDVGIRITAVSYISTAFSPHERGQREGCLARVTGSEGVGIVEQDPYNLIQPFGERQLQWGLVLII